MRKNRDEFACVNETTHKGHGIVVVIAILAVCITGILCARKLQMEQKYITMQEGNRQTVCEMGI